MMVSLSAGSPRPPSPVGAPGVCGVVGGVACHRVRPVPASLIRSARPSRFESAQPRGDARIGDVEVASELCRGDRADGGQRRGGGLDRVRFRRRSTAGCGGGAMSRHRELPMSCSARDVAGVIGGSSSSTFDRPLGQVAAGGMCGGGWVGIKGMCVGPRPSAVSVRRGLIDRVAVCLRTRVAGGRWWRSRCATASGGTREATTRLGRAAGWWRCRATRHQVIGCGDQDGLVGVDQHHR